MVVPGLSLLLLSWPPAVSLPKTFEIVIVANAGGASCVRCLLTWHGRGVKRLKSKAKSKAGYLGKDSGPLSGGGGLCSLQERVGESLPLIALHGRLSSCPGWNLF